MFLIIYMPDPGLHHLHKRKRVHEKLEEYPHPQTHKRLMDHLIYVVCIATAILALPQVWKIWSTQNAGGISLITYIGFVVANIFWIFYGILHKEKPIILLYVLFFIINSFIAIGRILYG